MKTSLIAMTLASVIAAPAMATASVDVTWENPKDYADVRPSNESRTGFQKRTFAQLDKHIAKLAEKLPDDYKLSMTVTDLDLAGQVWPSSFVGLGNGGANDVRLIKRVHIPRMEFSYTLTDATGAVVKSADVNIKDMNFMESIARMRNSDPLRYEKNMLGEWFRDELSEQFVKQ